MIEINKVYLGDCYELIKQIQDNSVDCIYTDIPYDIKGGGIGGFMAERIKRVGKEELKGLDKSINYEVLNEFVRVMKKINIFIWCNKFQFQAILNFFLEKDDILFEILTWNKLNPIPMTSNTWLSDIEYCLYFREKGVKLNDGYDNKSKWFVSPVNKDDKNDYAHPTIKPLELTKKHILHATQPNDIVLDPFIGSGTTAVACKSLGRNYIGFEIDSDYHKIAVDRINGIKVNGQMSLLDTDFGDKLI